jgi:hypothetical protein
MYSCPTDDIHSVYLDNELPVAYIKDYEAHIQTCEKCKQKLARLKAVHEALKQDSKTITLDSTYLTHSFERLQTKMGYSKHTSYRFKMPDFANIAKITMAAAAAVVVVALPVKFINSKNQTNNQVASITPVTRPQNIPISQRQNLVVNGNFGNELAHTVNTKNFQTSTLPDMDVFRPEFDENQNISIKISIPGLDSQGQEQFMEIKLPVNTITGQLP